MTILSIETSCDETAVSVVKADGDFPHATYTILGNELFSQVDIHKKYGGVFPMMAKREHAKRIVPLLEKALETVGRKECEIPKEILIQAKEILSREEGLFEQFETLVTRGVPEIDRIAVTHGPGLEPALWVGVNVARALALVWGKEVVVVNHMEGHVLSSLFDRKKLGEVHFPALALLISGGHTELVLIKKWPARANNASGGSYELIGQTRDDAVGEAFDKVARMLELPYPGGPEISKLAEKARAENTDPEIELPRPMIDSGDYDFSFSGLKTAVLYALKDKKPETEHIALEFENAVAEVLVSKTQRALDEHNAQTLILGGGVSANTHIQRTFRELIEREYPEVRLYIPPASLTTDNAVMIALAGHAHAGESVNQENMAAHGNLSLSK